MKYSNDTIKKFIEKAKYSIFDAETHVNNLHVRITKKNKKIGKVWNISTMPIFTCSNCKECSKYCYDIKACMQYKETLRARAINTAILKRDPDRYFKEIDSFLNRKHTVKHFRWHVAGDIINYSYLDNMVKIALKHPDFIFWSYTKNYNTVNLYLDNGNTIPKNLTIMFSEWKGMEMKNPYNMPLFKVRLKGESMKAFRGMYKCPGNCDICKLNNRGCIYGESTYNNEH